jgi:Lon protease-like protein
MARPMRLPLFPLHVVLFPHLPLPLHIFEERYRALTRDVLAEGSPFLGRFVVSMITEGPEVATSGTEAAGVATHAQQIGTIAEVRTAEQFPDGRWAVLAVGVSRAALGAVDRGGLYPLVDATPLPEVAGAGAKPLVPQVQAALDRYLSTVKRYVASTASLGHDERRANEVTTSLDAVLKPIQLPQDPLAASYAVGGVLQVELIRKQQLLELPDAASRLRMELDLLRRESRLLADGALPPVPPADIRYHPN